MAIFRRISLVLALLTILPAAKVPAAGIEQAYLQARQEYRQLLDAPRKKLYRENWVRVLERFLAFTRDYPSHSRADDAWYLAGKTAEGLFEVSRVEEDARMAVEYFTEVARRHPESNLADDALWLAGQLQEGALKDPAAADRLYRRILTAYPGGDMFPQARRASARLDLPPSRTEAKAVSAPVPSSGRRRVESIRHWANPGFTRVVIDLDGPAAYTAKLLGDKNASPRLYVDLEGTLPGEAIDRTIEVAEGPLERVRTGTPRQDVTRVVLDLTRLGDYQVFALDDPFRVVIDIGGGDIPRLEASQPTIHAPPGEGDKLARILDSAPAESPLKIRIPPTETGKGLRRIVVDAGHGGKDPGAVGGKGTLEKDVTLKMARMLANRLERGLGCEVVLTRDRDIFIPLEERTAIANRVGADLFISLHANASSSRKAHGVETYYLNFAKNDKAVAVVARENGTSLKEVGDLELILFDLMANAKINESSRLAAEIQKALVGGLQRDFSGVRDLGVKQGPFYVLLGATMPSVLVEAAFISNPREEARLKDDRYLERTADSIVEAVRNYAEALDMVARR